MWPPGQSRAQGVTYGLRLFLHYSCGVEHLWQTPCIPQSLKYWPSGPFQKKFPNPCFWEFWPGSKPLGMSSLRHLSLREEVSFLPKGQLSLSVVSHPSVPHGPSSFSFSSLFLLFPPPTGQPWLIHTCVWSVACHTLFLLGQIIGIVVYTWTSHLLSPYFPSLPSTVQLPASALRLAF